MLCYQMQGNVAGVLRLPPACFSLVLTAAKGCAGSRLRQSPWGRTCFDVTGNIDARRGEDGKPSRVSRGQFPGNDALLPGPCTIRPGLCTTTAPVNLRLSKLFNLIYKPAPELVAPPQLHNDMRHGFPSAVCMFVRLPTPMIHARPATSYPGPLIPVPILLRSRLTAHSERRVAVAAAHFSPYPA